VQLDSYERELERYGGSEGITLAERIFKADSEAVIELLGRFDRGDPGLEERWRMALAGIDRLLGDFGLSLPDRLLQLRVCARYGSVPEPDAALRQLLTARFRGERAGIEELLDPDRGAAGPYAPGLEVLQHRSAALREPVAALVALARSGDLTVSLTELIASLVHMHLNRLLRGAAKAHETVLYDYLRRVYQSRIARGRG
jgi:thiopeptide-type bacteriocin biosynthesis protein